MKKIINIGIVAHVDAGKTTITENLLYYSGAIKSVGRVDLGNTQTDSMELERKRGLPLNHQPYLLIGIMSRLILLILQDMWILFRKLNVH